jgi:hypothetical protein
MEKVKINITKIGNTILNYGFISIIFWVFLLKLIYTSIFN